MSAFDNWVARRGASEARAVFLEDALLSGRFLGYAVYRLRFFLGRSLIAAGIHLIEFTFLSFIFAQQMLVMALSLRALSSFLTAWWWGALEPMRSQVREVHRDGKTHLLTQILSNWLIVALLTAAVTFSVPIGLTILDAIRPGKTFDVFHLYVVTIALRLSLGIVTRTFHSAIYAIRRIYRPFFSIVTVELLGFLGTLLLWPRFGVWSFPLAQIGVTVVANCLTLIYVCRAYRFLGFSPFRLGWTRQFTGSLRQILNKDFFLAGCGYGLMQLDYVLVLALFYGARQDTEAYRLFLLFYLISPFVRSGYEWAQLFYFDLKRLELDLFSYFKQRFSRLVRWVAVAMGFFFWGATCLFATAIIQRNLGGLYALLLIFFLVRSHLAFTQIQAFAERRYWTLILLGGFLVLGVWLSRWMVATEGERLAVFVCVLFAGVICLGLSGAVGFEMNRKRAMLSLPDWINRLGKLQCAVRLRSVSLPRNVDGWLVDRIAKDILVGVRPHGCMTRIGERRIAWYERESNAAVPADTVILAKAAGLIEAIETTPYFADGQEAIAYAAQSDILEGLGGTPSTNANEKLSVGINEIKRRFRRMFPNGIIFDASERNPTHLKKISRSQRRQLMFGAILFSKNFFQRIRKGSLDVSTLCDSGRIRVIFGIRQSAPARARKNWLAFISRVNICHSINTEKLQKKGEDYSMIPKPLKRTGLWAMAVVTPVLMMGYIPYDDRVTGNLLVKPDEREMVYAPVAGFLRSITAREGDHVSAGSTIATLEVPDLTSRIAQKRAELKEVAALHRLLEAGPRAEEVAQQRARVERATVWRDNARKELTEALEDTAKEVAGKIEETDRALAFARDQYARSKRLHEAGIVSEASLERAKKELEIMSARQKQTRAEDRVLQSSLILRNDSDLVERERDLAEAKARLELMEAGSRPELIAAKKAELERLQLELEYMEELKRRQTIRAPIAGIITTPDLGQKQGAHFKEGDFFCEVADRSRLKVEITLPESVAADLKVGQTVTLKARTLPFQTFSGTVDQIAPVVDENELEREIRVYSWLDEPPEGLLPGMSGYARIHVGTRSLGAAMINRLARFVRVEFWW